MRRILFPSLVLALAGTSVQAGTPAKADADTPDVQRAERALADEIAGAIRSVDAEKHTFTVVGDEEKALTLSYGEATKFLLDGEEVDAGRVLRAGTQVQVTYEGDRARLVEARTKERG